MRRSPKNFSHRGNKIVYFIAVDSRRRIFRSCTAAGAVDEWTSDVVADRCNNGLCIEDCGASGIEAVIKQFVSSINVWETKTEIWAFSMLQINTNVTQLYRREAIDYVLLSSGGREMVRTHSVAVAMGPLHSMLWSVCIWSIILDPLLHACRRSAFDDWLAVLFLHPQHPPPSFLQHPHLQFELSRNKPADLSPTRSFVADSMKPKTWSFVPWINLTIPSLMPYVSKDLLSVGRKYWAQCVATACSLDVDANPSIYIVSMWIEGVGLRS